MHAKALPRWPRVMFPFADTYPVLKRWFAAASQLHRVRGVPYLRASD